MLPTVSSLSRSIRHAREKENSGPSVPLSLSELTIPAQYQNTAKGDKFLLYDSKDDDRVLIFGTKKNLELLSNSTTWMMDGTFQTVPALFYQLYTIHGEVRNAYFPLVFGLLPKKSEAIYVKFFEKIREFLVNPKVKVIITDIERNMKRQTILLLTI
ncbi:hypothetical protein Zmor_022811 [Zophobas morio]|uniref:MULE transposase domain-containing protein n=1 Tax=Zophobas morio TaxID=2755281 RepID=A0AA38HX67_9CUCU|nr:hypothetical protein Zmor_022811 [Zophobas morio]